MDSFCSKVFAVFLEEFRCKNSYLCFSLISRVLGNYRRESHSHECDLFGAISKGIYSLMENAVLGEGEGLRLVRSNALGI